MILDYFLGGIGNTTKFWYNISPRNIWTNRKNEPNIREYALDVRDGPT
jgi:hypothetical protein